MIGTGCMPAIWGRIAGSIASAVVQQSAATQEIARSVEQVSASTVAVTKSMEKVTTAVESRLPRFVAITVGLVWPPAG